MPTGVVQKKIIWLFECNTSVKLKCKTLSKSIDFFILLLNYKAGKSFY